MSEKKIDKTEQIFGGLVALCFFVATYLYYLQIPLVLTINTLQQQFLSWGTSPNSYLHNAYIPLLSLLVVFLCLLIPLLIIRLIVDLIFKKQ